MALSKVRCSNDILLLIDQSELPERTTNVVYQKLLDRADIQTQNKFASNLVIDHKKEQGSFPL